MRAQISHMYSNCKGEISTWYSISVKTNKKSLCLAQLWHNWCLPLRGWHWHCSHSSAQLTGCLENPSCPYKDRASCQKKELSVFPWRSLSWDGIHPEELEWPPLSLSLLLQRMTVLFSLHCHRVVQSYCNLARAVWTEIRWWQGQRWRERCLFYF